MWYCDISCVPPDVTSQMLHKVTSRNRSAAAERTECSHKYLLCRIKWNVPTRRWAQERRPASSWLQDRNANHSLSHHMWWDLLLLLDCEQFYSTEGEKNNMNTGSNFSPLILLFCWLVFCQCRDTREAVYTVVLAAAAGPAATSSLVYWLLSVFQLVRRPLGLTDGCSSGDFINPPSPERLLQRLHGNGTIVARSSETSPAVREQ